MNKKPKPEKPKQQTPEEIFAALDAFGPPAGGKGKITRPNGAN